jgi:hypothetical protein
MIILAILAIELLSAIAVQVSGLPQDRIDKVVLLKDQISRECRSLGIFQLTELPIRI